jgi:acyl-CoA thioester hydrolase
MGVAWHGHYLTWFELGRTELLREAGLPYAALEQERGVYFPVIAVGVRYLASAHYDDALAVETRVAAVSRVRIRFTYRVLREEDTVLLATGHTEHAAVGRAGRPTRMPEDVRQRLEAWQPPD